MIGTVEFEGGREMELQLARLKQGTAKGAMRRALRTSAKPMAEMMANGARRMSGDLANSVTITSKLSARQASLHRKMFSDQRSAVELSVGPGPNPQAITEEFGKFNQEPHPFVRPAWDADHMALLERLGQEMWKEITKAIGRAEKRGALVR